MENGERSGSGGRSDWRVGLTVAVGGAAGILLGYLVLYLADLRGPWPGTIATAAGVTAGIVLGQLVGRVTFHRPD